jgi:protein TonB
LNPSGLRRVQQGDELLTPTVQAARNLNPEDPVKRRFALPLALVLSGEFVLLVCLNQKVIAAPAPVPVIPVPPAEPWPDTQEDPTPSDDPGGAPAKPRTDLSSPLDQTPNPSDPRIALDLPATTIPAPPGAIVLPGQFPAPPAPGTGKGPGAISSDLLDNAPRTTFQQPPIYPYRAKIDGLPGEVVVEFIVDYNGRVLNPHVVSSTNPIFEETTLRAISQWRFEPGRRHGNIVRFRMRMPVEFHIDGN